MRWLGPDDSLGCGGFSFVIFWQGAVGGCFKAAVGGGPKKKKKKNIKQAVARVLERFMFACVYDIYLF